MAKSLQEILCTQTAEAVLQRLHNAPVHFLKNVGGDPTLVQTACGKHTWPASYGKLLDPNRPLIHPVTCPGCLAAMADEPTVVVVGGAPC